MPAKGPGVAVLQCQAERWHQSQLQSPQQGRPPAVQTTEFLQVVFNFTRADGQAVAAEYASQQTDFPRERAAGPNDNLAATNVRSVLTQFLDGFTILTAELDSAGVRFGQERAQRFVESLDIFFLLRFALGEEFLAEFLILGRVAFATSDHVLELRRVILQLYAAEVEHHERSFDATGEFQRLARVTQRLLPLTLAFGAELEKLGIGACGATFSASGSARFSRRGITAWAEDL